MIISPNKQVKDVVCCVIDYGTFISLAEKLGETMKKVYYYSPFEEEFQDIRECIKGVGLDGITRLDNFLDPDVFDEIDLFVFPDIGYQSLQRHLRSLGKAVWGQMGGNELELSRDFFLKTVEEAGLPVIPYERIVGVTNLREYLQDNDDKWIKVNRYRRNMETWHHIDYAHSERMLDNLAVIFGGVKEEIVFIVQDNIKSEIEIGYDGWCIDGKFPSFSFQGYEKKNELYLGSVLSYDELPDEIKNVNETMAPILKEYGYRDWWSSEVRVADGEAFFIDPTPRMPGLCGEQQLETCENLSDIIWHGAHGISINPIFKFKFAALAILHYKSDLKDESIHFEWKTLNIPKDSRSWLKLYHCCKIDGIYHFIPSHSDELGVVIGVGDSIEETLVDLKEHIDELDDLPVYANLAGFADLIEEINNAQDQGIKFADDIPDKELILEILLDK